MISPIKMYEIIKNWKTDGFEIVQKYETIDALWGLEHRKITDDDIAALKEGKCLYCNNGEYAQIISYKEESRQNEEVIALAGENIALAFQLGIAFGFAKKYDEMDKIIEEIRKAVAPQKESEEKKCSE